MLGRPWGPMSGNLYSDRSQNTYKTCRTQGFLYGEQRSTMAGNACLSEDMLDVRDLGNFACHCTHSFTKQKKPCFLQVSYVFWDLSEDRFPDIGPQCPLCLQTGPKTPMRHVEHKAFCFVWCIEEYNGRKILLVWTCVGCVWWWLGELFDSFFINSIIEQHIIRSPYMSSVLLTAHDQSAGHIQFGKGTVTPRCQTNAKPWACVYSLSLLPSFSLLVWVYEAI